VFHVKPAATKRPPRTLPPCGLPSLRAASGCGHPDGPSECHVVWKRWGSGLGDASSMHGLPVAAGRVSREADWVLDSGTPMFHVKRQRGASRLCTRERPGQGAAQRGSRTVESAETCPPCSPAVRSDGRCGTWRVGLHAADRVPRESLVRLLAKVTTDREVVAAVMVVVTADLRIAARAGSRVDGAVKRWDPSSVGGGPRRGGALV